MFAAVVVLSLIGIALFFIVAGGRAPHAPLVPRRATRKARGARGRHGAG